MNVYTCTDHDNLYVGGASVIVAESEDEARRLLDAELRSRRLKDHAASPYTLELIEAGTPRAIVLRDGDY